MQIKISNDGFIRFVDSMGTDADICDAARVSYGEGTRSVSDNRSLIRYLMRHRHTSPFEQAELKFHIRVPMDTWRQWIRHRTANVNEYSTRYSKAIDSQQCTGSDEWRLQASNNKQGSGEFLDDWPESLKNKAKTIHVSFSSDEDYTAGQFLTDREKEFHDFAREIYNERIDAGIAREQARKDLPLSTYTEAYWKVDLHNLLHFLSLRMDSNAQLEIREYSNALGQIVKELFPLTWEAFEDYRLHSLNLTRLDIEAIKLINNESEQSKPIYSTAEQIISRVAPEWAKKKCREREECLAKLFRLGLIRD